MLSTIRKILSLFEGRERWALAGLCGVIGLGALVQTIGVASIMPFMSLVGNRDLVGDDGWILWLYEFGGFESTRAFLLFAGGVVLGIMTFSNAVAAFQHWLMLRFMWRTQHRLAVDLLGKYLQEPYTFYLNQNTANLTKNILAEVAEVITGVLIPFMTMLAQTLVILLIFSLLLFVDVTVALVAALVLGGAYALIFIVIKRRQRRLGKVRRTANGLRFKAAAEALGSIKETKVLGKEAEFLSRFSVWNRRYSDANASNAIVADVPRYVLETLAFGGILVIVLYAVYAREDFGQVVAVTSLYALAGYRLLPALQHVFRGLAKTRFFLPALNSLHLDLKDRAQWSNRHPDVVDPGHQSITFEREIVVDGVSYSYPGGEMNVVRNITINLPRYTSVALVGSTGCGKTTLVDILLGLLEPLQGSVRIDDIVLSRENISAWRKLVGYVPQQIYLSDDTITRNIAFGVPDEEIDHMAVERAARTAQLHDFILSLADGYDTVVGERGVRLSGGQRQRFGIARALYNDPEVIIMDEATSALDGITEDAVVQAIRDLSGKKTIILVAHRLTTVRDCDAIYLLDRGEVVASGTYRELMQSSLIFRAMATGGLQEATVS